MNNNVKPEYKKSKNKRNIRTKKMQYNSERQNQKRTSKNFFH